MLGAVVVLVTLAFVVIAPSRALGQERGAATPDCIEQFLRNGTLRIRCRRPVPRRVADVSVGVDAIVSMGSEYNNAVQAWGYSGFTVFGRGYVRAAFAIIQWLQLGAAIGYTRASAGTATADGAPLTADLFDANVIVRFAREWSTYRGVVGRFGAELQGGATRAMIHLRGESTGGVLGRVATVISLGIAPGLNSPAFVLRLGYQYVPYGGAGAGSGDPVFSGVTIGAALELPL
jgi:hypothetical protein